MRSLFAGLVVVVGLSGVSLAQNTQQGGQAVQPRNAVQPRTAVAPGQAGQQGRETLADQQIATCVYGECHNEIEIAKFAESKAQSEEVRDFAQRMVRDHTPGCQEMQHLAGSLAGDNQAQPHAGGAAGGGLDFISIKKQIGQECLKSVKQELSSKQGVDFDHCFMGQQIGAHMKVVDELTVLRSHASPELRQKLEKELQLAQQHLQLAKQIEQKLKDRPSERVSRRPDGNK